MVDLHTHILCGMDDGAKDVQTSLQMLEVQRKQGVDTVVLTPHFYRDREHVSHFLRRRQEAWERLRSHLTEAHPGIILGAEVAWVPNLADCEQLDRLCIGRTKHMLLELPYTPWHSSLTNQLYDLMSRTGITPVLAHLERYWKIQPRAQVEEILSLDLPVQISASALLDFFTRGKSLRILQSHGHVLASDCHDLTRRKPDLAEGMAVVVRKSSRIMAKELDNNARFLCGIE